MSFQSTRFLPLAAALLVVGKAAAAESSEGVKFFEKEIRPLLAENCMECHGEKKHKGGLRLDNLPYIIQGGETGPGIVPHQPDKSLLIKAVSYADKDMEMPPDGKLSDAQIAALKKWITMGAPWPEAEVAKAKVMHKPGQITEEDRQWWAFQPLKVVSTAQAGIQKDPFEKTGKGIQAVQNPIDSWVRARLAKDGLQPAPEAAPGELIRRVYFDLTGLPPSPEAVASFVAECEVEKKEGASTSMAPTAYERLIDDLLASPQYGERQAQHWLDLTRYAESEGYRLDAYRPNVWPYRDYVIESFNSDKPYSQFVREQIAGDEIAPNDPKAVIGTAFLRQTIYEYNQRDAEGQWKGIINEVTDVAGDVFLGMSMQCAQCHDHKFDPILQKDYFRLQAFFNNITWPDDKPLATPEQKAQYAEQLHVWEAATVEPRKAIDDILEPRIVKAQINAMEKFPEEVIAMWRKPREQRTPYEEQIVQLAWKQAEYERVRFKEEKMKPEDLKRLTDARAQLATFDSLKPAPFLTAFIIGESGREALPAGFKSRKAGSVKAQPGFLTILEPGDAFIPEPPKDAATSGRRTVLADWIARDDNPLTTRVVVNRMWQHHFGRGIVGTSSDFGHLGDKPTHPEMFDWLTSEFVKGGWRMKPLHKLMLMSATYRQTAHIEPSKEALLQDPDNRLLWRFSPRRLDAEQARDAVLAATGELKLDMGGEGVPSAQPRRSIYTKKIRNTQDEFLRSLDAPAGFQSVPERQSTTTATQSLLLINGDWPLDRARAMVQRLVKESSGDDAAFVRQAFLSTYSREPTAPEQKAAVAFLQNQRAQLRREAPPPPPVASPLAAASQFFGPSNASKTAKALLMKPGTPNEKLRVNLAGQVEPNTFAIEAVVYLDSIYPDASVRTIASRWNNSKTEAGWCLGVTCQKSAYKPNNLILQLSGEDFQGSQIYEVVASNFILPIGKPYYVAASIDNHPGEGQAFGGTVTFYARDLSDPAAPMQTVTVNHQVCGGYVNAQRGLYVGGRDVDKRSLWDGAIARVALRKGRLDGGSLMAWVGAGDSSCLVDINADAFPNMVKAAPEQRWVFETSQPPTKGSPRLDTNREALADFCHALINSNEFFYLQ